MELINPSQEGHPSRSFLYIGLYTKLETGSYARNKPVTTWVTVASQPISGAVAMVQRKSTTNSWCQRWSTQPVELRSKISLTGAC